jgi:RNA polymerase sigma-70 factor (ECF subfamily)
MGEGQHIEAMKRPVPTDEAGLIAALRAGDEAAFLALVERYHGAMIRVAGLFVADRGVAEEVAQETWAAALEGLERFEGRASVRTWLFRILTNRAKSRAQREGRSVPFSAAAAAFRRAEVGADEPAEPREQFRTGPPWEGHWVSFPETWEHLPEEALLARETRDYIREAVRGLPPAQRAVLTLRDVEGWSAQEVCNVLRVSETNQRVLLHRGRARMRRALAQYLEHRAPDNKESRSS